MQEAHEESKAVTKAPAMKGSYDLVLSFSKQFFACSITFFMINIK